MPQAAAPRERHRGDRPQRGRNRADSHAHRARAADHATQRRDCKPLPRRSSGRASRRRGRGGTAERATRSASAVPQAAAPRERHDSDRPQRGRDRADSHAQRARAADSVALCQDREPPPRRRGGWASRHRERGSTTEQVTRSARAASQAAAPRERRDGDRPQRGRDRADSHAHRARPRADQASPVRLAVDERVLLLSMWLRGGCSKPSFFASHFGADPGSIGFALARPRDSPGAGLPRMPTRRKAAALASSSRSEASLWRAGS